MTKRIISFLEHFSRLESQNCFHSSCVTGLCCCNWTHPYFLRPATFGDHFSDSQRIDHLLLRNLRGSGLDCLLFSILEACLLHMTQLKTTWIEKRHCLTRFLFLQLQWCALTHQSRPSEVFASSKSCCQMSPTLDYHQLHCCLLFQPLLPRHERSATCHFLKTLMEWTLWLSWCLSFDCRCCSTGLFYSSCWVSQLSSIYFTCDDGHCVFCRKEA